MEYISIEDLKKWIIRDNCDEGCGYIDERDIVSMEWVEDNLFIPIRVIEDIKTEIESCRGKFFQNEDDTVSPFMDGTLNHVLTIIDKHITKKEKE